jgi:hypothetical protein
MLVIDAGRSCRSEENGTFRVFARLDPTMTGYHLAFGDDGWLYVSYPTLSGSDQIYRITPDGEVHLLCAWSRTG